MADGDAKPAVIGGNSATGAERSADVKGFDAWHAEIAPAPGIGSNRPVSGPDTYFSTANFKKLGFSAPDDILPDAKVPIGYGAVASTIGSGALNELTQHKMKLGVIAVGTGVVTEVATQLATAFLKREAVLTIGGLAAGWGVYKLYENVPTWIKSADVVAHGTEHTAAERVASQKVLKDLGAGGVDLVTGGLGAGLARPVANLGRAGWVSYSGRALPSAEAGLAARALPEAGTTAGDTAVDAQGIRTAAKARVSEPFLRNDNIQVPRGMPMAEESEGKVYEIPGDKILKVKLTGITSAEEEANALVALGDQGVRVPRVFEVGKTAGDGHDALVMQKIDGDTYRDVVISGDKRRLTNALHDLIRQIGIMSKSGVAADDIQFKNLIIGPKGEVTFIDPLRIVSSPSAFKVDRIIQNMILNGARP